MHSLRPEYTISLKVLERILFLFQIENLNIKTITDKTY